MQLDIAQIDDGGARRAWAGASRIRGRSDWGRGVAVAHDWNVPRGAVTDVTSDGLMADERGLYRDDILGKYMGKTE